MQPAEMELVRNGCDCSMEVYLRHIHVWPSPRAAYTVDKLHLPAQDSH